MPNAKPMAIPKELAGLEAIIQVFPQAFPPSPTWPPIVPFVPDTHTAQFNKEIFDSLVLNGEVIPPPGQVHIDINDMFKLKVTVSNNYEYTSGPFQLYKLVPKVWFKDVVARVYKTTYIKIQGLPLYNNYYYCPLCIGTDRLKPGDTRIREISVTAVDHMPGAAPGADPIERIAYIQLVAALDLDAFFSYSRGSNIYAQIENP